MSPAPSALWLLPATALKWGGLILGLCALLLLADLLFEHWRIGREIDRDIEEDGP